VAGEEAAILTGGGRGRQVEVEDGVGDHPHSIAWLCITARKRINFATLVPPIR